MTVIAATVPDFVSLIKHINSSVGLCYATIGPDNFLFWVLVHVFNIFFNITFYLYIYLIFIYLFNITSDQGSHWETDESDSDLTIVERMNFTMFSTILKQVTR